MNKFSIKEVLAFGWETTKKNFWFLLMVMVGTVVVMGIFNTSSEAYKEISAAYVLLGILGWVAQMFITIGLIKISLKLLNGERGGIEDFKPTWRMFWNMFFGSILYSLVVFSGLILLIVPGLIWAARYSQVYYLIVDKDMGPIEALKESGQMTYGEKWHLVLWWLSAVGVVILGALALLIGLLWALPTVYLASALIYRKLEQGMIPAVSKVEVPMAPTV